jgi:hypothetical protein
MRDPDISGFLCDLAIKESSSPGMQVRHTDGEWWVAATGGGGAWDCCLEVPLADQRA